MHPTIVLKQKFFGVHWFRMDCFSKTYSIRASEIGVDYRMRKTDAAALFQQCLAELFAEKALAGYDMAKMGLTWITSDMAVSFEGTQMPFWREEVQISVWLNPVRSDIRLYFDFEGKVGGARAFKGSSVQLVVDKQTRRIRKNDVVAGRFPRIEKSAFELPPFGKIPDVAKVDNSISKRVRSYELDFNNHLNNVQYLPISFEAIPREFRAAHSLEFYHIKFLREVFLDDLIESKVEVCADKTATHHVLERQSDGAQVCKMLALWRT